VRSEKLNEENKTHLRAIGVEQMPYEAVFDFAATLCDKKVSVNPAKLNYTLYNKLRTTVIRENGPIAMFKAIKNEVQIAGIRQAMVRDGVALVRFFRWLDSNIDLGTATEISAAQQLRAFRAEQNLFVDESFGTICGYNEHGAIVHYSATPESDVTIRRKGFLLVDSGAQYLDGTTDITRTVSLGNTTAQQKRDFTLVMKGHIAVGSMIFPAGTRGAQLDALARQFLWKDGLSYLHGTGHGVGHFLNVHEGPHQFRMNHMPTLLEPGMNITNEPGIYKAGNTVHVPKTFC
jgi:Xaa-Pro aminopeptidase